MRQAVSVDPLAAVTYDIILVGVGGQGVLTIGELIAETAMRQEIPVSFYPTKGMAQRGGFIKAQVRLGRHPVGPNVPERGADLAIAMELSEALKAIRFLKPGAEFLLFSATWLPTAVMLGQARYPSLDEVREALVQAEARVYLLDPASVPHYHETRAPENLFVLGAALSGTGLGQVLDPAEVSQVIEQRWVRHAEPNRLAFRAGLEIGKRHA